MARPVRPPHVYTIQLRTDTWEDVRLGSEVHTYLELSRGILYRERGLNWLRVTQEEADQLIEQGASGHCRERGLIIPARDIQHLLPANMRRYAHRFPVRPAPVNTWKMMMFVVICGISAYLLSQLT